MSSQTQIDANRLNATHSTGPQTETGKQASSQNHLTLGLYTRKDYVKPEDRDLYADFCETMYSELGAVGILEATLATEVVGASWRLHRCAAAEGDLADYAVKDPLLDDATEKTRRSIDRARASAHSHFHRAINQLRKMQTEREIRFELLGHDTQGLAECSRVDAVRLKQQRTVASAAASDEKAFMENLMAYCEPDPTVIKELDEELNAKFCAEEDARTPPKPRPLASNCSNPSDTAAATSSALGIAVQNPDVPVEIASVLPEAA